MTGDIKPDRGGQEVLRATGHQLSAHIDELLAQSDGQDPRVNDYSIAMARLLAERIERGVEPAGLVNAVVTLEHDVDTGVDSWTEQPMPLEVTQGVSPVLRGFFFGLQVPDFVRGAFGDKFADQFLVERQSFQDFQASQTGEPQA